MMEVLWIGHAGILIKIRSNYIAIDPFLTGSFKWYNKTNTYRGLSPWIGSKDKITNFSDKYGKTIRLIAITHEHGDHYDATFLLRLIKINPDVKITAPKRVISSFKRELKTEYSTLNQFEKRLIEINKKPDKLSLNNNNKIKIIPIPLKRSIINNYPKKVAYLIKEVTDDKEYGLLHIGDAHDINPIYPYLDRDIHLMMWSQKKFIRSKTRLIQNLRVKKIWWLHWERFAPGNFTCNVNIQSFMKKFSNWGIPQGILPFDRFEILDD